MTFRLNPDRAQTYLLERTGASDLAALLEFPRFFEIETVHACNARCAMCTIHKWPQRPRLMSDEVFDKLAGEIALHSSHVKRVSLYRDGEPLLDPGLAEKIRRLKDDGISEVAISTNAALLTPDLARSLLAAGLDMIIFSVDSLEEVIYEQIRCGLSLPQVLGNIQTFINLRNRLRPRTHIRMRMIRQKLNYDQWPDFEAYWRARLSPSDRVYFNTINNWGGQLDSFEPVSQSYEPRLPCVAMWTLMAIFSNGDVPYCNVDFTNSAPLGEVRTQTIQHLWQSTLMQERRRVHLDGGKDRLTLCRSCNAWDEPPDVSSIAKKFAGPGAV